MLSSNNLKQILTGLFNKNKEEHDKDINHLKTNMNKGWISSGTIDELHGVSDASAPFDYYSEDELLIGQWIDGKPLYRSIRSINTDSSNKSLTIDISDLNIDKVIKSNGFFKRRNDNGFIPLPINISVAYCYYDILDTNKNKITLVRDMSTHWADATFYCYFEYTKTTDTSIDKEEIVANGINMQLYDGTHYSEDELLIGQWIDGKPLYRKVYKLPTNFVIPANAWTTTGIPSTDKEIIINSMVLRVINGEETDHFSDVNVGQWNGTLQVIRNTTQLNIYNDGYIIVEYTKTTDEPFSVDEDIAWYALDSEVDDIINRLGE